MKLTQKTKTFLVFTTLILVLAGWLLMRKYQGPEVTVYRIQSQPLVQTVVATGRVTSASRAQVGAEISGIISERLVREGDEVQAGDVLAVLRDKEQLARVGEAQASLAELRESSKPQADAALRVANARYEQAKREAQRRRDLYAKKLIAHEAMEQANEQETEALAALEQAKLATEALAAGNPSEVAVRERLAVAEAGLEKTLVRAQVSGTVLTRNAEPGDVVQTGRVLFEIARENQTELVVPVDERNLSVLRLGQPARCVTDAFPDHPFPAIVSFIAPAVDPQRGSVDIRLQLKPVPEFLRQDMTVTVNVETGRRQQALVIPNDAINDVDGGNAWVWKVEDGQLKRIKVTLGLRGLVMTEATSGLDEGDLVVSKADDSFEEGNPVRTQVEKMIDDAIDNSTAGESPIKFD